MDKALVYHAGSPNPNTTKDFSAPILLGTPAMCSLSNIAFSYVLQRKYLSWGGKKRGIMVKSLHCHL